MAVDKRPIPQQWKVLMDRRDIDSIRKLAGLAGIVTSTGRADHNRLTAVIMDGKTTSEENMVKVARALGVDVEELYRITSGVPARPLTMPVGTEKLSERQRNAVAEIVRSMVEEKEYVAKLEKLVDKKSRETAEQVQEKNVSRLRSVPEKMAAREEVLPRRKKRSANPAEKRD